MRVPANTTLVVGAGGSCPYGFPTGSALRLELAGACADTGHNRIAEAITKASGRTDLWNFASQLHRSNTRSIDEFVGRRTEWVSAAKAGIAAILLLREQQRHRSLSGEGPPVSGDWLCHLVNSMLAPGIDGLTGLQIVTFNFDRVIEHCIFEMLTAGYGFDPARAASEVARLGIVHVNGSLGRLPWEAESGVTVDFGDGGADAVFRAMGSIQFVHEERAKDAAEKAAALVRESNLVCFLGFGFHPDNVDALDLRATRKKSNAPWLATGHLLTVAEAIELQTDFTGLQVYTKADALKLLRSSPHLHGHNGGTEREGWSGRHVEAARSEMRGY